MNFPNNSPIKLFKCFISLYLALFVSACDPPAPAPATEAAFDNAMEAGVLTSKATEELSGLVASQNNPTMLWAHNDSGDQNTLYLLDKQGNSKGTATLENATNRDWEDIAYTTFADGNYLYIGDIGDNTAVYDDYAIYRAKEPALTGTLPLNVSLKTEKITFRYADGKYDAECLLIDHQTKDLYVVTKRDTKSRLYRLPYPQSVTALNTAQFVMELPFNYCTAGDISADNQEILLKNYQQVFYWKRRSGETLIDALKREPTLLTYPADQERQGEAIAWAADASGFYTVGEKLTGFDEKQELFFYKKK